MISVEDLNNSADIWKENIARWRSAFKVCQSYKDQDGMDQCAKYGNSAKSELRKVKNQLTQLTKEKRHDV